MEGEIVEISRDLHEAAKLTLEEVKQTSADGHVGVDSAARRALCSASSKSRSKVEGLRMGQRCRGCGAYEI